jgi:hypothetical protein
MRMDLSKNVMIVTVLDALPSIVPGPAATLQEHRRAIKQKAVCNNPFLDGNVSMTIGDDVKIYDRRAIVGLTVAERPKLVIPAGSSRSCRFPRR